MVTDPRAVAPVPSVLRLGGLVLSEGRRSATLNGADLGLSGTEFALLWALAAANGDCVSVGSLLRAVGWAESTAALSYLDLYIRYLRDKLGDDAERPTALIAVRRSGYMLASDALPQTTVEILRLSAN
jgi:two-component system, OmpR family, KDP operon response regulator KdpE